MSNPSSDSSAAALNPYAELHDFIKQVIAYVPGAEMNLQFAREQARYLDQFDDHEAELTGDQATRGQSFQFSPLFSSLQELALARGAIERSFSKLEGTFAGEFKRNSEDRLAALLRQADSVYDDLIVVEAEVNQLRRPHQLRELTLRQIARGLNKAAALSTQALEATSSEKVGQDFYRQTRDLQQTLSRVSETVNGFCTDPHQKMGDALETMHKLLQDVNAYLPKMKHNLLFECQEAGLFVYSRAGIIKIERMD